MSRSQQKVVQYLNEAHAAEGGLVNELVAQIAMTPKGAYRSALERHLGETRDHAERLERRLAELGEGGNPLQAILGAYQSALGQAIALGRAPLAMLRGTGGEEKILKNAKDSAAAEAMEIATYTALERLATAVGDEPTAKLARSIRADEERMLQRVLAEIPKLAQAVVGAEVDGEPSYDITQTGAADAAREAAETTKKAARSGTQRAKRSARQARKVPGVAQVEGQVKGAVASAEDLAIPRYQELTADEIVRRLPELSQVELAKVDSFERRHGARTTVLNRVSSLRGSEPWPGYDELNADEVRAVLGEGDEQRVADAIAYERSHKNRSGVIAAAEREIAQA